MSRNVTEKKQQNNPKGVFILGEVSELYAPNILTTSAAYMDGGLYFVVRNKFYPNRVNMEEVDCRKFYEQFILKFKSKFSNIITNSGYYNSFEINDVLVQIKQDLILTLDIPLGLVQLYYSIHSEGQMKIFVDQIKKFQKRRNRNKPDLHVLVFSAKGIETKLMKITNPKIDISLNYNEDLADINKTILSRLSRKNEKGLVLLHGKPGTGKTTYIRYLMAKLKSKKKIIFLPPKMASSLTNPDIIKVSISNPNSIFVIEDAEQLVIDREQNGDSPVSAILNLTDGLLSDCLNIQIICSFNTEISRIDNALLRKGRLIARYEFKALDKAKSNILAKKLGLDIEIKKDLTLAEIYNYSSIDFGQKDKVNRIGFVA
jgi:energy-coupling factor transporter ATP-binding protein EcfA2